MKIKSVVKTIVIPLLGITAIGTAQAAVSITLTEISTSVELSEFVGTGTSRGSISLPVAANAGHGYYTYSAGGAMALLASGSGSPSFSITFQNNTGDTITGFTLSGTVYQFKDNSNNVIETLAASISGITVPSAAALNALSVSNNGDSSSTPNNPPLTAAYSGSISDIVWENGESIVITWSDVDNSGVDAMFGLGGLSIVAFAVPEPASALLGALGLLGILRRRR